ncbi:MAG: class I SAM-dependent methyltransferase [Burkholderiales bacterium]|nr:class I SAM-dependent methyltransferase [Burkholderiales bacterium]
MRSLLRLLLLPLVWLTAPLYALVARTGAGAEWCRRFGWHPVRVHFYHPVPEYEKVDRSVFEQPRPTPGIDLDPARFAERLAGLGRYAAECSWPEEAGPPGTYHAGNGNFGYSSAALLHCMLRAHRITRVVEVGGGFSSLISMGALAANARDLGGPVLFTCVEPYPSPWLAAAIRGSGGARLLVHGVQQAPLDLFGALDANSLLFIDSSHVSKLGSDVNFLFLDVLPRLAPGTWVHVHDIYLPYEYPAAHFFGPNKLFWNEQYLLQAFLAGNRDFEVVLPGYMVQRDMAREFGAAFPRYDSRRHRLTSSFWMRRRPAQDA